MARVQNRKQELEFRVNSMCIQLESLKEGIGREREVDGEMMRERIGRIVEQQYA
jgi:hypothetical protein